jgi:O-antigen ligase
LADIVIFGFVVVLRTHSNTPIGGLIAFGAVVLFWEAPRHSSLKSLLGNLKQTRSVFAVFTALVVACSWGAIQFQSKVLQAFGETVTFNGRSEIWKYSWNGFLDRPLLGWGWMSAWRSWAFMKMDLWWTVEGVMWSHNAYLDVLLGGGVFAVGVFAVAVVWGVYRLVPTDTENPIGSWPIAFVFFYLLGRPPIVLSIPCAQRDNLRPRSYRKSQTIKRPFDVHSRTIYTKMHGRL